MDDVMRITTLKQLVGMLAVTATLCGTETAQSEQDDSYVSRTLR
jgi:hypothetical protein